MLLKVFTMIRTYTRAGERECDRIQLKILSKITEVKCYLILLEHAYSKWLTVQWPEFSRINDDRSKKSDSG